MEKTGIFSAYAVYSGEYVEKTAKCLICKVHMQYRNGKNMREAKKTIFPHYPQSYPQKKPFKPAFCLSFAAALWITFPDFAVVHSPSGRIRRVFQQSYPALVHRERAENRRNSSSNCNNFTRRTAEKNAAIPKNPGLWRAAGRWRGPCGRGDKIRAP